MRAAPPLQEVDLTGAKTNKGRFWWELRKRRALSQQTGFIEMQMARPRPRRATSRPLTSQPPRRAGLNGPIDAPAVPTARGPLRARGAARPPERPGLASPVSALISADRHHLVRIVVSLPDPAGCPSP